MNGTSIIRLIPNLWMNRNLVGYFAIFLVLLLLAIGGLFKVFLSYSAANEVKKEIATKTQVIQDFQKQSALLNSTPYRPTSLKEIEQLQEIALKKLANNHLSMVSFANVNADPAKENGLEFNLSFIGEWQPSVLFIEGFHLNNALVVIRKLSMETTDGDKIKTSMRYKIYLK